MLIDRGLENFQNLINWGVKINGRLDFEKRLYMIVQGQKGQKQVVIEHKTKIYTAVRYFAMKSGVNSTNKERK